MTVDNTQELVLGGFTDPQGSRVGLGALLVDYFSKDRKEFLFAGKVGTGLDTKLLLDLRRRLDTLEVDEPPFTIKKRLPKLRSHWARRRSSSRSLSRNGRGTASCGIHGCSGSVWTNRRATSCGSGHDRQGITMERLRSGGLTP